MNGHVSMEHAKGVCKMGRGHDCCRYLGVGAGGMECLKHSMMKWLLDSRVAHGESNARGDNCDGIKQEIDA